MAAAEHKGSGTLWTGHTDGSIRAHLPNSSEAPAALRPVNTAASTAASASSQQQGGSMGSIPPPAAGPAPITALSAGDDGIVWAGDAAGRCLAVVYEAASHAVRLVWAPRSLTAPAPPSSQRPSPASPAAAATSASSLGGAAGAAAAGPAAGGSPKKGSPLNAGEIQPAATAVPSELLPAGAAAVGSSSSGGGGGGGGGSIFVTSPVTCILSKQGTVVAASLAGLLHLIRGSDAAQLGVVSFRKGGKLGIFNCFA